MWKSSKVLCCLNLAHEHMGHKDIAEKLRQTMQANGIGCDDFYSDYCNYMLAMHVDALIQETTDSLTGYVAQCMHTFYSYIIFMRFVTKIAIVFVQQ